ncbi:non-specific lipid-transfer protein 8-like [Durio zibethinus]|uniref:Non-specific lipid-transfer protein n=1 Tax=Durio zibethinus TaxID=66656 RepID=A0A6P5YD64_DURZI|nr:non-specific lipid-transfer protein 8-like [Durio zibethinus]
MMASRIRILALVAVMLLLLLASASNAAISCSDVIKDLRPCVNYLVNGTGKPPAACCAGASAASSSADKKAACECIKSVAKNINPKSQLAQALPSNCGINLPVTVSPTVDCSNYVIHQKILLFLSFWVG